MIAPFPGEVIDHRFTEDAEVAPSMIRRVGNKKHKCIYLCASLCALWLGGELFAADTPASAPATAPATMPAATPATPDASGRVVITFDKVEVGKAIPSYTDKGVTFTLA